MNLLLSILNNNPSNNRYTKAFINLKNVFDLERQEKNTKFTLPKYILKEFEEVGKEYEDFINGVPLRVVERYYNLHIENLNKMVFFEYQNKEVSDIKVIELYNLLEDFYDKLFNLACQMANVYNIEIKINEIEGEKEESSQNKSTSKRYI